jgi:hypothetical protein
MFEVDGTQYTLSSMLEENRDDEALCDWLRTAQIGDFFPALVFCVRVS